MKRLIYITLLAALVLTACTAPATPAAEPAPATEAPAPVQVEEEPAQAEPQPNADGKVEVQITMGDNWIQSSVTTFKVGVPYVFVITNTGNRTHNFNINKPAEKTTNGVNDALANALLHVPDFDGGSVLKAEYTFTEPAPAGSLEFSCLIERHYKSGQHLAIVVEE